MKKINITMFASLSFALLLGISSLSGVNNLKLQQLNQNEDGNYNVSDYEGFKEAIEDTTSETKTITFQNNISLSNVATEDLNILNVYGKDITINGDSYGFINKNSTDYFIPIFDYLSLGSSTINNLTFQNLTLNNVGAFIGFIDLSGYDYDDSNYDFIPSEGIGKGLTFQNITVKNTKIENLNQDLNNFHVSNIPDNDLFAAAGDKSFGFLANDIRIIWSDLVGDESQFLSFYNINIKNNTINNNTFRIIESDTPGGSIPVPTFDISSSFLTNLSMVRKNTNASNYNQSAYVSFQYIYINDNQFKNNTIIDGTGLGDDFIESGFTYKIEENFGNLLGCLHVDNGENPITTYFNINDIYISNNIITESKRDDSDGNHILNKYNYSELISNTRSDNNQNSIINSLENIFIFNNENYYLTENFEYELAKQENINLINISIEKDTTSNAENILNNSNVKNLFIYGTIYDENQDFNLFQNVTSSSMNVYYGKYLYEDSEDFDFFVKALNDMFGFYSYQINFEQISEGNQTKNVFSSISKVNNEHIDVYYDNFIYSEKDPYLIEKYELKFKYYQPFDSSEIINVPYQLSNLKLYNVQNNNQKIDDSEIIATSQQTLSIEKENMYSVVLDLNTPIKLTQSFIDNLNLNNLYLGFDYSNDSNQKVTSSTILKLNPNQLTDTFPTLPLKPLETENSKTFMIIMISVGVSIFLIILLTILILLIIWKMKNKSSSKKEL